MNRYGRPKSKLVLNLIIFGIDGKVLARETQNRRNYVDTNKNKSFINIWNFEIGEKFSSTVHHERKYFFSHLKWLLLVHKCFNIGFWKKIIKQNLQDSELMHELARSHHKKKTNSTLHQIPFEWIVPTFFDETSHFYTVTWFSMLYKNGICYQTSMFLI